MLSVVLSLSVCNSELLQVVNCIVTVCQIRTAGVMRRLVFFVVVVVF